MSDIDDAILAALDGPSSSKASENGHSSEVKSENWGPAFYDRRRADWIAGVHRETGVVDARVDRASSALERLEEVLSRPGVVEEEEVWEGYLKSIHSKLVGGTKVRKGMLLSYAIKILQAGWLRDGTWTGEDFQTGAQEEGSRFRSISTAEPTESYTAYVPAWMARVEDVTRQIYQPPKKKSSRKRSAPPSLASKEDEKGVTSDAERGSVDIASGSGGHRQQVKRSKSNSVNSGASTAENRPEHDGRAEGG